MKLRSHSRPMRGQVTIYVEESGKRTRAFRDKNLIVNQGRQILSQRAVGTSVGALTTIQVGQKGNVTDDILTPLTPSLTQTALIDTSPFVKVQAGGSPTMTYAIPEVSARFVFTMETTEGNNSNPDTPNIYTEAGLFTSDGLMFAVENFPGLVKINSRRFIFEWVIYF